jgi:DNA-binding NtrC family response regulator
MNKNGSIVIVDDDVDDREILDEMFKELKLPNEVAYFESVQNALLYLRDPQTKPFIVISDLHLQELDGFELKEKITSDPVISAKSIPLIFVTTGTTRENLIRAYKASTQGIFIKPPQYDRWKTLIKNIYDYWQDAIAP